MRLLCFLGDLAVYVPEKDKGVADMPTSTNKPDYDRRTLEGFIDRYLEVLAKNDPSGLPLADGVRFVENNQELEVGEGTWRTVTGLGRYRHYFIDTQTAQSAVIAVIEENGKRAILNLRLKLAGGKISEIESLVVRDPGGAETCEKAGHPAAVFLATVPEDQRRPRERLVATADQYFTGMVRNNPEGDYSFFADGCNRMENGRVTTNAEATEYGHSTDREFVTMTAREQFETGFLGFVTRIRDRRFFVVDEEYQSVISFAFYDHDATVRKLAMPGGKAFSLPPYFSTPRTLEVCESFKLENDQIQYIEVTLTEFPYGTRPAWDTAKDPWLRQPTAMGTADAAEAVSPVGREQLTAFADRFLAVLVSHDAKAEGITDAVRYTENGQQLNIGDGLWRTAAGIGENIVVLADPATGSVGLWGSIREYDVESLLAARLKVRNGEITEIEALVMRHEYSDERLGTFSLFAPRLDGMYRPGIGADPSRMTGQVLEPGARLTPEAMMALVQGKSDAVRERHLLVADADRGLLLEMTLSDIANPNGGPIDPASSGPYSVLRVQLHEIRGGAVAATRSVLMPVPYKMGRGW